MSKATQFIPLAVSVASKYFVVQKFCFYCPRALGPDATALICEDCKQAIQTREKHLRKPSKKKPHTIPSVVTRS